MIPRAVMVRGFFMKAILTNFGAFFGYGILGVGTISAVTYALFKIFSEKWLTAKFDERLAAYKHEQQKELEQLRYKINSLMDRTIKLHQREFEVLPDAWAKLADAYASVGSIVLGLQYYPDLNRMNNAQLSEVLEGTDLPVWKQDEVKAAPDKTSAFRSELQWKRKNVAKDEYYKFNDYLRKNGIFIHEEMKSKFAALNGLIHMALIEHELNLENPHHPQSREHSIRLSKEGESALSELEKLVQGRLWDSQAISAGQNPS
jgi:hypothetical protein